MRLKKEQRTSLQSAESMPHLFHPSLPHLTLPSHASELCTLAMTFRQAQRNQSPSLLLLRQRKGKRSDDRKPLITFLSILEIAVFRLFLMLVFERWSYVLAHFLRRVGRRSNAWRSPGCKDDGCAGYQHDALSWIELDRDGFGLRLQVETFLITVMLMSASSVTSSNSRSLQRASVRSTSCDRVVCKGGFGVS